MKNIFAVYKPKGLTSHDVVDIVRQPTGKRRVGHAGTLDPLARGVLVVGVGREATRALSEIVAKEKEYIAQICLGYESTTDDEEGEKKAIEVLAIPGEERVREVIKKFIGTISQTPPVYSALKVKGKTAYARVRAGEKITLEPREVIIKSIVLLDYTTWPMVTLSVTTGPGVYIRALARDVGRELGVGGYLKDLERVRVGQWTKKDALTLDKLGDR